MIEVEQTAKEMRKAFYAACKEKQVPVNNRAVILYALSYLWTKDFKNEELKHLLLIELADLGAVLGQFADLDAEYMEEDYKEFKIRYARLVEDDKREASLAQQWQKLLKLYNRFPQMKVCYDADETIFSEETRKAAELYRKYMEVSEKNSLELNNNLHHFIGITKQAEEYRQIVPLFLFQLMVRHTRRLAEKENLEVSLKSLWSYKGYQMEKDNGKNYKQYKLYIKLFSKLCKLYHKDEEVDLELCRYGFCAVSNLSDWAEEIGMPRKTKKLKKVLSTFRFDLYQSAMSSMEYCEPPEYSSSRIFGVAREHEERYLFEYADDCMQVEEAVQEYVLEHLEYVLYWLKYIYVDIHPMQEYVEEIYKECIPKLPKEKLWMENCIRMHIFDLIQEFLDKGVRSSVISAFKMSRNEDADFKEQDDDSSL